MEVEIVTHVFGEFYCRLLAEQLRSLRNKKGVVLTVACERLSSDCWQFPKVPSQFYDGLRLDWMPLDLPQLCNRNIGRNLAAKATKADWVWFADADYLFGPGSLEAVAALDPHAACMYWPRLVLRPEPGDWFDDCSEGTDPAERCTRPETQRKAIGGCQIVPGHIARQWGYLDGVEKHQRPATGNEFLDTRGDKAYRFWLPSQTGLPVLPADIPNVMRLRHRIPETSQRHLMTLPEFRLNGTDATLTTDEALSRD